MARSERPSRKSEADTISVDLTGVSDVVLFQLEPVADWAKRREACMAPRLALYRAACGRGQIRKAARIPDKVYVGQHSSTEEPSACNRLMGVRFSLLAPRD